jgi:ATP-dependent Clp protease ATP-binding subunit ClpA
MRKYFEASFARGELRAIGATTWTNTKSISKRQSTRKTFQEIIIEEPDTESAISICVVSKRNMKHTTKYK